jgi:hypothetical protein
MRTRINSETEALMILSRGTGERCLGGVPFGMTLVLLFPSAVQVNKDTHLGLHDQSQKSD